MPRALIPVGAVNSGAREVTRQAMRNGRRIGIITLIYLNCILSLAIAFGMFLLVDWASLGDDDDDI